MPRRIEMRAKAKAEKKGMPYEQVINHYLKMRNKYVGDVDVFSQNKEFDSTSSVSTPVGLKEVTNLLENYSCTVKEFKKVHKKVFKEFAKSVEQNKKVIEPRHIYGVGRFMSNNAVGESRIREQVNTMTQEGIKVTATSLQEYTGVGEYYFNAINKEFLPAI